MQIEAEHLEHFGVKGMKWGVRKEQQSIENSSPAKNRRRGYRNIAIGAGVGVVGGLAVGGILKRSGMLSARSVSNLPQTRIGKNYVIQSNDTRLMDIMADVMSRHNMGLD